MDDFEYSVQISELDWDAFFRTCEECNMLPPGLAGLDDSGMSDMDDMANQRTQTTPPTKPTDPEPQIDGPPVCEGSPVELYLSKYGLRSPDQVLSGSEDDFHLEAVNVFFERLKSVSLTEDQTSLKSKLAEGHDVKDDNKATAVSQSNGNPTAQRNDRHTCMYTESTDELNREICQSTYSDTELFTREENWSLDVLKDGGKWEAKLRTQPDTEKSRCSCNVLINRKNPTDPNKVEEANSQQVTSSNSDLVTVQDQASSVTPRRRRRKKKRMSAELVENYPGYEVQLPSKVSDSDKDILHGRRKEVDQETHMAECCGSGTAPVVCCAPHDVAEHHRQNSISENLSGLSQAISAIRDISTSPLATTNFQKELHPSAVSVVQRKREIDIVFESNLNGQSAENGQLDMRTDHKSPEPGTSVTETPQRDDCLFGDNAGNHLQLNNHLPSVMLVPSDVSKIKRNPASIEHLVKLSVSHHVDDTELQTHSTELQLAPLIATHNVVCSKPPKLQFEDRVPLSHVTFDGSGAAGQRKTSISCVTFPELTDSTLVSASLSEEKENSSSVTHIEVPREKESENLKAKGCVSGMFDFNLLTQVDHVYTAQINHQNGHMIHSTSAQISETEETMAAPSVEPKACISKTSENPPNEGHIEENCPSSILKNLLENMNMKAVEILPPDFKGHRNEEVSVKGQTKTYQSLKCITDPDSQLSDYSESEPIQCSILTNSEKQKAQIHCVDIPPCFPYKDLDLSPSIVVHSPSPPPESTDGPKSIEIKDADIVSQPTPPIYAMSSFWNEMEKLTINDILRLRLVGQAQHPSVLLHPEDNIITDVTDADDSGFFMHVNEPKPDQSSGEISLISDFDGGPVQLLSPDAGKQEEETPNPKGVIWESDPNVAGTATETADVFHLDAAQSSSLHKSHSSHCFRKLCKNVSVQNLQELENQNFGTILRNASLHPIDSVDATHSEVQADYVDPFDRVDTSSPVYLSEEEDVDSTGITFSEIIEYLFGTDEPKQSDPELDAVAASYPSGTETSVPEMYDHFFSEFEPDNLFYPLTNDNSTTTDELVPIFSSSRSATRNVQFPEVYDYFFPDDSPVHSDEDEEPEQTVIRVVTRYDYMPARNHDSAPTSDPYKDFFPEKANNWNFTWTNPFSFRRIRRTGFTVPPEEPSSQALTPVKHSGRSFRRGIQPINVLGVDENPFPDSLLLSLDNHIFKQLAEQQKLCKEMQTVVADPRLDAPLLPIKQADMCLVCIALASWVLKSVNPQGADTWKAALLANISALSAIRYLRRFTRDEAAEISPLRQIKPA